MRLGLATLVVVTLASTGCFYAGGGARASFDVRSHEPTYSAQGFFGGFTMEGADSESLGAVTDRTGFVFSLAVGAGFNQRLSRWEGIVGPRFGFLFPHGIAELGFETRFGSGPQLYGLMLSVGPRLEVRRSYSDVRSAHVISIPVNVGFMTGDGFRPELGVGVDYHLQAWRPNARFD